MKSIDDSVGRAEAISCGSRIEKGFHVDRISIVSEKIFPRWAIYDSSPLFHKFIMKWSDTRKHFQKAAESKRCLGLFVTAALLSLIVSACLGALFLTGKIGSTEPVESPASSTQVSKSSVTFAKIKTTLLTFLFRPPKMYIPCG